MDPFVTPTGKGQRLDVSIQRAANISIHQQLVTQISLQIASGLLPEGTKLPSVRALSKRLNIHYNTCLAVYKELNQIGLLESLKGSGVRVSQFKSETGSVGWEGQELQQMAKYFLQIVQEKGYTWPDVERALTLARQQQTTQPQLTFVDIHPDILPIFQAELQAALVQPVQIIDLSQPLQDSPNTCYIVSRYHFKALKARVKSSASILMIDVANGQHEIERIKALPEGALVTIISHSTIILQIAESVMNSLRGDTLLFRSLLFEEGIDEIRLSTQHATLIIADALCAKTLKQQLKKPISTIQLIPDSELEKIKDHLKR